MTAIIALVNAYLDTLPTFERIRTYADLQDFASVWQRVLDLDVPAQDYRDALIELYSFTFLDDFATFVASSVNVEAAARAVREGGTS